MRRISKALTLCLAAIMVMSLVACGGKEAGTGMFENANGGQSIVSAKNNNTGYSGDIGKKEVSGTDYNMPTLDKNTNTDNTDTNNETNVANEKTPEVKEEEPYVEPEVVEQPMPQWITDTSYGISSMKKTDPEDAKCDTYYIDDMLYVTILSDEIDYRDIDINFTYEYGSLQPADPEEEETDTHKIKDLILYLKEPMSYEDLVTLQENLDKVSTQFKVELKTVTGISNYVTGEMPESTEESGVQEQPKQQ